MKPTPAIRRAGRIAIAALVAAFAAFSASAATWTYSGGTLKSGVYSGGTITDGQWTLNVSTFDPSAASIGITGVSNWTDPGEESKSGVLDLSSPLISYGTATTELKSVRLGAGVFAYWTAYYVKLKEFYCDILSSIGVTFQGNGLVKRIEVGGSAETMPSYFMNGGASLEYAKFNFPNMRKIEKEFLNACKSSVDISTLVTPGVTNVASEACKYSFMCGEIALTNVMTIGDSAFNGSALTSVSLAGPLASLGAKAFGGSAITNVVLDLPKLETIAATAFTGQKNIRRVELVTALKDMGQVKNIVAAADNASVSDLRVYVSKNQWTPSKAETYSSDNTTGFFSALTDDEKNTAPAKAFGVLVVNGVRKGFFVNNGGERVKTRGLIITFLGGGSSRTDSGDGDSGDGGSGDSGDGDGDGGSGDSGGSESGGSDTSDPSDRTWTYSASATNSTITDGQWTLAATLDKATGALSLSGVSAWTDPKDDTSGVLNLNSPLKVTDGSGVTTVKSVALGAAMFASWSANSANLKEFSCDIVSSAGVNCFKNNTNVTKVEIGGTAETIPECFIYGCTALQTATFDFPNLRKIDKSIISACKNPIDISTLVTPGVTNITGWSCQYSFLSGAIALTNVMAIGDGAFNGSALTSVSLAGPLTSLGAKAFGGSTITNVVLDLPNLATVASTAFTDQKKIRRVELVTALKDMGQVTNIVAAANNSAIKDLVVYVSTNQWKVSEAQTYSSSNTTGFFSELTTTEKTSAPTGAFGVLVVKGTRKGIFVHNGATSGDTGGGDSGDGEDSGDDDTTVAAWTYSATDGTITDGQWTLKVSSFDAKAGTLAISKFGSRQNPTDTSKSGILDLNNPLKVTDGSSVTTVKSVTLGASALANATSIVEFYCDIVSSLGENCFSGDSAMTTVKIGGTAETLPYYLLDNCTKLKTVAFDFPGLRNIAPYPFGRGGNERPDLIDVSTYAGPGVTNVSGWASQYQGTKSAIISGDLVLTNVMALGTGAFQAAPLTSATLAGSLAALNASVFEGSVNGGSLTNVVLDLPNLATVAANAFNNQAKIRRVELVTRLADMGALTNIVATANNTAINELVVYVSTNQWKALAAQRYSDTNTTGFFSELTTTEKTSAPAGAFGVLVVKGTRKGVFVHKASATDSKYPAVDDGSGDTGGGDTGGGDSGGETGGDTGGDGDKGDGGEGDGDTSGGDKGDGGEDTEEEDPPAATSWTYSSSSNTLTDGQWTLKVSSFNATTGAIAISGVGNWTETADTAKLGVINLNSPLVVTDANGTQTTVKSVTLAASAFASNANLVEFHCDLVSSFGEKCFEGASKMTTLKMGGSATTFTCPLLKNCTSLVTAKFDFPKLNKVSGSGGLFSATEDKATNLQDIPVSSIAGPGVTSVGQWNLKCTKLVGELVLTNVSSLAANAFQGAALTGVSLAGSLSSLPAQVFEGSAITNVVLDLPKLGTVAESAFNGQTNIRRVELVTRLAQMDQLPNIVAYADNASIYDLVVYVSTNQWKASAEQTYSDEDPTGFFAELTAEEKADAPAGAFGVLVVNETRKGIFMHKVSYSDAAYPAGEGDGVYAGDAQEIVRDGLTVRPELRSTSTDRMRILNNAKIAYVNMSQVSEADYETMAERAFSLMKSAADSKKGGDKRPLMGWSSWNVFRVNIDEEKILSIAGAMATNGLKDAGYSFVNIDDGGLNGRDSNGNLRANLTRFPNGLRYVVDRIHEMGFKAGTYSDAGSDTCGSYDGDATGKGTGFYGHEIEDARFFFEENDFDFIKIDYCGARPEALNLDEQERYTAIRRAIDLVKPGVRMNICRWTFPGAWAAGVAESWRTTADIGPYWGVVWDIIAKNIPLTQFSRLGHYNDMDMLEVGHIAGKEAEGGLTREEERTHFGMWCFMSSPLLLGFDLREMDSTTKTLITNPFLIGMNQNDLGAPIYPVNTYVWGTYTYGDGNVTMLVKDCETLGGTSRYLALFNSNSSPERYQVDFFALDLGGKVKFFDLVSRSDIGEFKQKTTITIPAHGAKFYRLDAETRLDAEAWR